MMRSLIQKLKLIAIALLCVVTIPLQLIVLFFTKGSLSYILPQLWDKITCAVLRLKIQRIGKPLTRGQVFYVGNHLSHFDIFILGSLVKGSFIAKDDLASMPGVNLLCYLQQTVFVSRSSEKASKVKNDVENMARRGNNIILFPEGTSTRGETVLDFKSSLFSLPLMFADKGLTIQPFTLKLLTIDGRPADTKELRDTYAWDRDNPIELGPHIINFAKTRGAELQVIFHDPVKLSPDDNRKILAKRVQEIVAAPLEQSGGEV